MTIKSFVGGHEIKIFENCVFDPKIRKYTGGSVKMVIPHSGKMLSAKVSQSEAEPIEFDGGVIPTLTPQVFTDVDSIPCESECDYCVVSAMYVAACKSLGIDTSRLLTIGSPVANESGQVIGAINLNRN